MDICNEHFHILSHKFKWRLIICSFIHFLPTFHIALCSSSLRLSLDRSLCVACQYLYNGLMIAQWQTKNIAHIQQHCRLDGEKERKRVWLIVICDSNKICHFAFLFARSLICSNAMCCSPRFNVSIGFVAHKVHSSTNVCVISTSRIAHI